MACLVKRGSSAASHPGCVNERPRSWRHSEITRNYRLHVFCAAQPLVVGVGGVGMDYLASVAMFPRPDQKLRTEKLNIQGGGNSGNACTGLARMGFNVRILSAVGKDPLGDLVVEGFQREGVDTTFLRQEEGEATPFTYIIIDTSGATFLEVSCFTALSIMTAGGTRTCIHTAGASLHPDAMTPELCSRLLEGADLVYFDGRQTESAITVARAARAAGIPVLVEAERLRPRLEFLLAEADFLVTSSHFPEDWTGEPDIGHAMVATALRFPNIRWMVTTQGERGSILFDICRTCQSSEKSLDSRPASEVIETLFTELERAPKAGARPPACKTSTGVAVLAGRVASTPEPVVLPLASERASDQEKLAKALHASATEASADPDAVADMLYMPLDMEEDPESCTELVAREKGVQVFVCSSSKLPPGAVVDTTGAGDAFLASLIYGVCKGKDVQVMLQLASLVAACKCTQLGARPGLPTRDELPQELL